MVAWHGDRLKASGNDQHTFSKPQWIAFRKSPPSKRSPLSPEMKVLRRTLNWLHPFENPPKKFSRKEKTQTLGLWWQIQPSPLLRKPFPLVHLTSEHQSDWTLISIVGTNMLQNQRTTSAQYFTSFYIVQLDPQISQFKSSSLKNKNMAGWWLGHPSEKYERQLGWLATQYMGKCQKWQPFTTNQMGFHRAHGRHWPPLAACWKDLREPSTKMGHATPSWSAKRASTASGVTSCGRDEIAVGWI